MALLGGTWTPNVIWHLASGPRRFGELRHDMPGVTAKVLSARLKDLQRKGVVDRDVKETHPPSVEYALTALGLELVPAIQAIVDIGHRLKGKRSELALAGFAEGATKSSASRGASPQPDACGR